MVMRTVERHPDREALVSDGRRWTYLHWNRRINQAANVLAALGIRSYDRVAIFIHSGEAAATVFLACQKLGAIAVPVNFRLSAGELAHILNDSGARALIYGADLSAVALLATAADDGLFKIQVGGASGSASVGASHDFDSLMAMASAQEPNAHVRPEMISALVYTSGTTGRAKGVIHTHENDVAIAMNCALEYQLGADDRALHIAPLYHVGGMQAYFTPHLFVGAANIIAARYSAAGTLAAIAAERITSLFAVPTQIQEMLFHPDFKAYDTSSLQMITTGGAAIPSATMERVMTEFSPRLYNGYGMTEASLTLLLNPRDALSRLGSCGKSTLISRTRVVINDPARDVRPDECVADGEVGQLIVQGPQMTPGYWNNPAESDKRLRHGWLYTGDLFRCDEQGYHYFQGRADDMIVSGGENIYPREVEEVLHTCPGVREAAVIGLPDNKWGSIISAFIVRSDAALTKDSIDAFCKSSQQMAAFKRPKRFYFVDSLPTNPSGKVMKRELTALATELTPS
ncbi:AMP-binding protein [Polaromonas sp. CG_23.6]|uniref:class I adenylate-forming enzyme family protein n=1 Tax=Polaromonas sp. CG_23.6 TaxID=2760709 RepID=UPI0024733CA3|nr:AMP-binding protein [Polaromonas sp. CG_23.6]MDH6186959.1 fatty-acyl-CoA synthase [Polaromonas sp. CG_23.6]